MKPRFLLIDEDERDMPIWSDELTNCGADVVQARNSREIQEAARNFDFDGVILDLMMPEFEGLSDEDTEWGYVAGAALYRQVLGEEHGSVPFIILTAVDPATSIFRRALDMVDGYSGYRGFLEKPVDACEAYSMLRDSS